MRDAGYVWGDASTGSAASPEAGVAASSRMIEFLIAADLVTTLGQIATSVNHRLRGPLTSMKGMAQIIDLGLADREMAKRYAKKIIVEIDRLDHMLSQVLFLTDQQRCVPQPVNLHEIVDEVLLLVQAQAALQAVTISRAYATDIPEIPCDARRIKQAVLNLVVNALQAMPDGGELSITTSLNSYSHKHKGDKGGANKHKEGAEIHIAFKDSGPGVPRSLMTRIFTPFFTTKKDGTGLGLTVARHIAQAHGGNVELKRSPGPGALFVMSLPAAPRPRELQGFQGLNSDSV
ncbi:MAG TPA: hypothetical protein GXX51_01615 [Firmicutes bacterium]|nr:hypothetical protein [Bacillota bacterium]